LGRRTFFLLFSRVIIPQAVAVELASARAPEVVRRWVANPPAWLDTIQATQILMDDLDGRIEAERRHLKVTGTLGILVEAHRRGLLDFDSVLARLSGMSLFQPSSILRFAQSS
jgi:predicted nucleic acid-binding protein